MEEKEKRTRLPDDDKVLEDLAEGWMVLLERLYTGYWQLLLRITYHYLAPYLGRPSPEEVEDCIWSFLLNRFEAICGKFNPEKGTFRNYFNFCLERHCISFARKILERRMTELPMTGLDSDQELPIPDRRAENDIEQVALEKENLKKLKSYIDELDDRTRTVVVLYSSGLTSTQIGKLLGIVPVTVRVMISRIKKKWREIEGPTLPSPQNCVTELPDAIQIKPSTPGVPAIGESDS